MTMHLAREFSTINTRKRKPKKLSQKELQQKEVEWRQHNKEMRRRHLHDLQCDTLEDYIKYIHGEYKTQRKEEFKTYEPYKGQTYRRETPQISSFSPKNKSAFGYAAKKEPKQYTGTLIKGIGTMHKSNAIPVIDEQQMKDLASMRR